MATTTTVITTTTTTTTSKTTVELKNEVLKIDYNLPKEKNINSPIHLPERFSNGIIYSTSHYTPHNFHYCMSVPKHLPHPAPTYKYSYTPSTSIVSYLESSNTLINSTRTTYTTYAPNTPLYCLLKSQQFKMLLCLPIHWRVNLTKR